MATGSISVSGLLGGTAGQIDTTTLISQLMQAQAIPQAQLKDQLSTVQTQLAAYQSLNTRLTAVQAAAQALTDAGTWRATTATSSSPAVVATSSTTAATGSTTFSVTQLARAQVTTVAADASGTVVSVPSAGVRVTDGAGVAHSIALASGSATDVAAAINSAGIGVRASVVQTNTGAILQVSSVKTGAANAFTLDGTDTAAQTLTAAQDAKVTVGDSAAGGYTVTSPTNTFTGFIEGVTFTASALAPDVTISVGSDSSAISAEVQALVTATNAALSEIAADTAKGAVLQGKFDARSVATALTSAVSSGTTSGGSLKQWGVDLDSSGQMSFDTTAFAAAYAADPAAAQAAVSGSYATNIAAAVSAAIAPVDGTITAAISAATTRSTDLGSEIDTWTTRLATIQANLQAKYAAMQSALARLQSQQTYLKSMFDNIDGSGSNSGSN